MVRTALKSSVIDQDLWTSSPGTSFRLAGPEDNFDLRQFEKSLPIPGWVTLSYERESDYFQGEGVMGDDVRTYIYRSPADGSIVCKFTIAFRLAHVNGKACKLGYLGQLRLASSYTGKRKIMKQGFDICLNILESESEVPFYLTSIIKTNDRARRNLTARLSGKPNYTFLCDYVTLAIACTQKSIEVPFGYSIMYGTSKQMGDISEFINSHHKTFQFSPKWTDGRLLSEKQCPGLKPGDFVIAVKNDQIVGCVALWDQSDFKQHVVRGYRQPFPLLKPLINVFARMLGYPGLPDTGKSLKEVYLSHFALRTTDGELLKTLVQTALNAANQQGHKVAMIGFADGHPHLPLARKNFRNIPYESELYAVHWGEENGSVSEMTNRPVCLEAATL